MKNSWLLSLAIGAIALSVATTGAQTTQGTAKKPVTATAKKTTTKPNNKPIAKKVSSSGFAPQSEAIKALAEQFKGGQFNCEFDNTVRVVPNKDHAGYFTLTHKGKVAQMLPVPTNTGALRLEGKASGLVWLQLPSKSMLMNSKIGQRLADECHATN